MIMWPNPQDQSKRPTDSTTGIIDAGWVVVPSGHGIRRLQGASTSVTEHRIRLRGGWECVAIDSPGSDARGLTLPTRWDFDGPRRLRLIRRFNQPRLGRGVELVLQLQQVPGIRRLDLDGEILSATSRERTEYEIDVDRSIDHHRLVIEIETPDPGDGISGSPAWGIIALVIRTTGP